MALASKDAVSGTLPPFFTPADFVGALAIIFEPKKVARDIQSKFGPRDYVTAQVSVFMNEPQLEAGRPVVGVYSIGTKAIVDPLIEEFEKDEEAAVIAVVESYTSKRWGKDTFVLRQPKDGYYEQAAAYYEQREAALQAAIDDAPSFDD